MGAITFVLASLVFIALTIAMTSSVFAGDVPD
jgi:hypothetical protein